MMFSRGAVNHGSLGQQVISRNKHPVAKLQLTSTQAPISWWVNWWVETNKRLEGAYLLAVWRSRSDCLTDSLSFQTPRFLVVSGIRTLPDAIRICAKTTR